MVQGVGAGHEAAKYRYPVNRNLEPWDREQVDLSELEKAGASFEISVIALIDELAALETLPIEGDDAAAAAKELQALIGGCEGLMRVGRGSFEELRRQRRALELGMARRRDDPESDPQLDAVDEVMRSLATRSRKMVARLVDEYGLELDEPSVRRVKPMPVLKPIPLQTKVQIKEVQDGQMKTLVDNMVAELRPLGAATNEAYERSLGWEGPAARQLHLDIARFRSRLGVAKAAEMEEAKADG